MFTVNIYEHCKVYSTHRIIIKIMIMIMIMIMIIIIIIIIIIMTYINKSAY